MPCEFFSKTVAPRSDRAVSADGENILIWNLNTDEWYDIACRAAGRNMTQAEWEELDDRTSAEGEGYPSPSSSNSVFASSSLRRAAIFSSDQVSSSASGIGPAEASTSWRCFDLPYTRSYNASAVLSSPRRRV